MGKIFGVRTIVLIKLYICRYFIFNINISQMYVLCFLVELTYHGDYILICNRLIYWYCSLHKSFDRSPINDFVN